MSRNYVWTCQGCTDLAQKIDSDWNSFFKLLLDLKAKITRWRWMIIMLLLILKR